VLPACGGDEGLQERGAFCAGFDAADPADGGATQGPGSRLQLPARRSTTAGIGTATTETFATVAAAGLNNLAWA
jgi:hypothetical protein